MLRFTDLLNPVGADEFFSRYWGRAPLLSRDAGRQRLAGLLTLAEVDRLLADFGRPAPLGLRLAKRESDLNQGLPPDAAPNLDTLMGAYAQGHTLNINRVAERHAGVRAIARELFIGFRCAVSSNLFLTPPDSRAFAPHFDTHDVLVLQFEGAKRWKVWAPVVIAPLEYTTEQREVARERLGEPLLDVVLGPGDVLYVPRGFVHEVFTESEYSLHVSHGIHAASVRDLLVELVDAVTRREPSLRETPAAAELLLGPERIESVLRDALSGVLREIASDSAELLERIESRALLAEPSLPGPRFSGPAVQLESTTRVCKRRGAICRVSERDGAATIAFQGNVVRGPSKLGSAFRFVASRSDAFTAADLPATLSERERVMVARRLFQEGLLTLDEAGALGSGG